MKLTALSLWSGTKWPKNWYWTGGIGTWGCRGRDKCVVHFFLTLMQLHQEWNFFWLWSNIRRWTWLKKAYCPHCPLLLPPPSALRLISYTTTTIHTYVNMFGLRGEECALRLPYKISGPFPCRLAFMPPLAKRSDATASIIQPQFSCSGATCYGSVVSGSPPQAATAMRGLTSLMGWQEIAVKRSKVPVTAVMKEGHGGFLGSQKKHINTFAWRFMR